MVLTDKFKNERLKVIEDIKLEKRNTQNLLKIINKIKLKDKKALIGIEKKDKNVQDSSKNLKNVKIMTADSLNIYSLLKYEYLILTKKAVEKISKHFLK